MLRKLFAFGCLFAMTVGSAAIGCGGTKAQDAPPAGPKYPSLMSFCNDGVAVAECSAAIVNACNTPATTCPTSVLNACINGTLDFEPGPNGLAHYDSSKAEACVDKLHEAYATQPIQADAYKAARAACKLVFSESRTAGSACKTDFDCDQDKSEKCIFTSPLDGSCQVPKMVGKGDDCAPAGSVCVDGYHCTAADQICGVIKKVDGDACSAADPCATGSICDNIDPATGMGACAGAHPQGTTCTTDAQCEAGTFCARFATDSECAKELGFAKGSDTCKAVSGG